MSNMKFLWLSMLVWQEMKDKFQNDYHLNVKSGWQNSNHHILEAHVHIHVKDEVSVTSYMDRTTKKEKCQNGCHLKTLSQIDLESDQHT